MSTVAELLIRKLRDAGVRTLFGVPGGGGNLDLIAAAGRGGIPFVLTSTESGGAMAAIAQAEVSGAPGACLTTLGPGAASVVNGVACAHLERAPIVVFTDSYAVEDRKRYAHQRLDQAALFRPITNYSGSLAPATAVEHMTRAFEVLGENPTGPVHLDCPADFNQEVSEDGFGDCDFRVTTSDTLVSFSEVVHPNSGRILSAEEMLRAARKPIAIVGLGARTAGHARAIRDLLNRVNLPAMVTYKAKGVVPDSHQWFAGVFTNAAIEKPLINESDLVIGIGLDEVEFLPRSWTPARFVRYGPEPLSTKTAIGELAAHLQRSTWTAEQIHADVEAQRRKISIAASGMTAQRVVEIAADQLAREARVTVDAGAHMLPAMMLWPIDEPNGLLISNGLSTMGFALPAAIGAALLDRSSGRERPVVALTGDGGLLMCVGELLTAVRERLRIIVIVFNDASLSLIEIKQQARRLAPAGVALGDVSWARVADGFGVASFVAADEAELERAIARARNVAGPSLIEARIDRSNYPATLQAIRG